MKHSILIIVAFFLLVLIGTPAFSEGVEETQARRAVEIHNTAIEKAEKAREIAIEKAYREYCRTAIIAKHEYIRNLQDARRKALKVDNVDAATKIVEEIDRVREQIECLSSRMNGIREEDKSDKSDKADKADKHKDYKINHKFVGFWKFEFGAQRVREYEITKDAKIKVNSDSVFRGKGSDVGSAYDIHIIDENNIVIHYTGWLDDGNHNGHVESYSIKGNIITRKLYRGSDGFKANRHLQKNTYLIEDVHIPKEAEEEEKTETNPETKKEDPNPTKEQTEEYEGNTLFGVPIK